MSSIEILNRTLACKAILVTAPEGGTLGFTYSADFNDNIITIKRTSKPNFPLASTVTALSYDAVFNKPTQIVDQLNQITIGGSRATMIPDIQGSILATLDSGTGTFTRQNYLPYGKSASATITGTFGYTGQRIDTETNGLYYYRARMYHPAWGRFMQPDPLGTLTDNPQASVTGTGNRTNLYVYVNNDPLNSADPSGLWQVIISGGFGGFGGSFTFGLNSGQWNVGVGGA